MIIDGEKWACEACVRGHRVSNCQHADRPLQHINKKGRPVSQCQHCRAMRKSRASHVKCDCGEKSHKCAHLKTTVEGHRESCCCNHGGRCTCSHKKEPPQLDPVRESDSDEPETVTGRTSRASSNAAKAAPATAGGNGIRSRRRANTIHSDSGMLSFDENGRQKRTYKHVKALSKCEPYPLKRVNSMHSAGSLGGEARMGATAGRESSLASRAAATGRRVKSETTSPLMTGSSGGGGTGANNPASSSSANSGGFSQLNGQLPPLDLSGIEYPRYMPNGFDLFGTGGLSDHEQPMFSAGLSAASVDWSHYDGLDFGGGGGGDAFTPSSYGQAQSYGGAASTGGNGFDFNGSEQALTMTTTTSGDVSEVEDFTGPSPDDFDISGAFGTDGNGPAGFSHRHHHGGLLNRDGAELTGASAASLLDFDESGRRSGGKFLTTTGTSAEDPTLLAGTAGGAGASFADDALFWMGDYISPHHSLPTVNDLSDPNSLFWET